ncbi:OmpA family protein [Hydrogenophaga sp. NFH-34]|uniref:OmpA family protein n=1 Tax=Hydrogenophaga sp. NFH-34 TaxID=2744446 RepID=UPI001F2A4AB6|nr:OmpA family protein [Hydrogenophaga sp. NFH-34]
MTAQMPRLVLFAMYSAVLGACTSPPKPPTVDESQKRPANAQMAVELQVCKNDLQNTRIQANESDRLAETTSATLVHMAARQQLMAATLEKAQANSVRIVHFGFNSTRVSIPSEEASALVEEAKAAPLVVLRGRTDGTSDSSAESRIAQARANAVRDYLVAAGVDPARIRTTHQPSGDHLADNGNPRGRNLNRRVEIEVYRAPPVSVQASATPKP